LQGIQISIEHTTLHCPFKSISAAPVSFTTDGPPSNLCMAGLLGVNLDKNKIHEIDPRLTAREGEDIYYMLDPAHMLKLIRNCFGAYHTLYLEEKWPT